MGRTEDGGMSFMLAALQLARRWAIFPIEPGKKNRPLNELGARGATRDLAIVEDWWRRWPNANVAVATGAPSGIDVLDVAGPHGEATLAELVRAHAPLPATIETRTSRGRHLFFFTDSRVTSTTGTLGEGLNTRGAGGYVVVPPSVHPNGQRYLWTHAPIDLDWRAAPWPTWILDRFALESRPVPAAPASPGPRDLSDTDREFVASNLAFYRAQVLGASPGDWGDILADAAQNLGSLVALKMLSVSEVRAHLLGAWAENPELDKSTDPRQLDAIILKGLGRGTLDYAAAEPEPYTLGARGAGGGGGGAGGGDGGDGGGYEEDPEETAWWHRLAKSKDGFPKRSLGNLIIILNNHEQWIGCLGTDERTGRNVWLKQPPWDPYLEQGPYPRKLQDSDEPFVVAWLEDVLRMEWTLTKVNKALLSVAALHPYERVREYLDHVANDWDGKERLDGWLVDYMGAEPSDLTMAIGARWMISAVARVYEPGCQVDHVLVLEGAQGAGKSTALKALCPDPDWFTDNLGDVSSKDASETLQGPWIVEIAELDALSRAEAHTVKAFLTRTVDRYRGAYARHVAERPRRCVFAASTNEAQYLRDATGGRRFWPVKVNPPLKIASIRVARDMLWGEAVHRYRNKEAWHLVEDHLVRAAQEAQEDRFTADEWENLLEFWLLDQFRSGENKAFMMTGVPRVTVGDALGRLQIQTKDWTRQNQMRVADILTRLGWHRVRRRDDGKQRWCYEPTPAARRPGTDTPRDDFRDDDD